MSDSERLMLCFNSELDSWAKKLHEFGDFAKWKISFKGIILASR